MTKNFSVKNAWLVCVALSVGLNFSACGEFAGANSPTNTAFTKSLFDKNPANDIVAHLRMLEKHKQIYEISEDDMYRVPTETTFGQSNGVSGGGVDSAKMQAWELMLTHKDEIFAALREAGYNQAQITGAYRGAFYYYADTCESALYGGRYTPYFVKELAPYCETYKNDFAQAVKKGKRSPYSPAGTTHAYMINEIPKLVAQIYNKPAGIDDYHEAQARLKKLSDEDLGVPKERKAKLDAMVESLSGAEMAGVLTRLDTAISELRISGLTQEQTSVVLSDVFFRYANECERAQNAINTACDTYHKEFAPQISQKDEHRDYLKYARSVIPAKVVLAYTSDISKDRQRIEKEKQEFSSSANLGALSAGQNGANSRALDSGQTGVNLGRDEFSRQNGVNSRNGEFGRQNSVLPYTNDESGISWGEVFKLIADLATIAKFALKF